MSNSLFAATENVVVDLLQVKWKSFVKREFFTKMFLYLVFFCLASFSFIFRKDPAWYKAQSMKIGRGSWRQMLNPPQGRAQVLRIPGALTFPEQKFIILFVR